LGYKKCGFGAGKIAGIGGKVEPGETIGAAACRELYEEIGVTVEEQDLHPRGSVAFRFPNRPSWDQVVYIFVVNRWRGEPQESDEMRPCWHPVDAAPFDRMWDDNRYWLPRILAGEVLTAQFTFAADNETVCDAQFVIVGQVEQS
jgi:8-oxo-dGTP diphosphatase